MRAVSNLQIVTLGGAMMTAVLFGGFTKTACAAIIKVTSTADSGLGSLRQALAKASNGDSVDAIGIAGTITLTSDELVVSNSVSIIGPGSANLTINGSRSNRVFHIINNITATIAGLTIYNGVAGGPGGGILNDHSTLTVSNCTVTGNFAYGRGGGIGNDGAGGGKATLTVINCILSGNESQLSGGGIGNDCDIDGNAVLTVIATTFHENYGITAGGGLDNYTDRNGTGIVVVSNCTFTRNKTGAGNLSGAGGAIANSAGLGDAAMTVSNCVLTGNYAWNGSGGGIANAGALTVIATTLSGNTATNTYGSGGGIHNGGTLTVSTSTLSGNAASFTGGGIDNYGGSSTLKVSASTLYDNTAYRGSAICNGNFGGTSTATMEIGDTILVSWDTGGTITNISPGAVISDGFNLSNDSGGGFLTGVGDQTNTDPLLGPLQNNGGATFTHALLPGSPAIDRGNRSALPALAMNTDQRALLRPVDFAGIANAPGGDGSDIGAFEVQLCQYSISPTNVALPWLASAGSVAVTASGVNCVSGNWEATSSADWITVTSGGTGNGSGTVNYSVASNTNCSSRVGALTIASQTFTMTQEGLYGSHLVDPDNRTHGTIAESGSFAFVSSDNCSWTATPRVSWIHTASSGTGSGTVDYLVDKNYGIARSGGIEVEGVTFTINQEGNILAMMNGVFVVAAGDVVLFPPFTLGAGGSSTNCSWDFGDGGTSTGCDASHVFTNCGTYLVNVTGTSGDFTMSATTTVAIACEMSVTNFQAKLNFAKPNLDSCKFKATTQPSNCTNLTGIVAALDVGGARVAFTLDARGRGVNSNSNCRLTYNQKTRACTFSVKLSHGTWQSAWTAYGLANGNYPKPGIPVTLPVILVIGNEAFMAEKPLHYTATVGKSGVAK